MVKQRYLLSDPFSSFSGEESTRRFKQNADQLGALVLDPTLKITLYEVDEGNGRTAGRARAGS